MTSPFPAFPPFAGLCTYEEAARVGLSVEESVRRLLRLHWTGKRLLDIAVARLPATPEWEVKCALALHQHQDAEHTHAIRTRISEMRSPPPAMDRAPDDALERFLREVLCAADTVELVAGLAFVRAQVVSATRDYLASSNPLVDHPTRRVLRFSMSEDEQAATWYAQALDALTSRDDGARIRALAWRDHLKRVLAAAGGLAGTDARDDAALLPPLRSDQPFVADTTPRRDVRFTGTHQFEFPPQTVYNAANVPPEERNLALLCRRALEMDVPETIASFMAERRDRPWDFYRDYARQLWDEARHAMMGTAGLHARGIDWTALPLHVGFSLRLNRHAGPLERQILLYAIEQSLMPADTGKRSEYETAVQAGDALSAHFHDFDWADEVLHAQIGRRWMKHEGITVQEAIRRGAEIHERTWPELEQHSAPHDEDPWKWWRDLVRDVLGTDSRAAPSQGPPRIVAESG